MNRRPVPGDDEDDILRMQEEFLKEKEKNKNLQPAAQSVDLRALNTAPVKRNFPEPISTRKPSKYAQAKGLKSAEKKARLDEIPSAVLGNILEKNNQTDENNQKSQQTDPKSDKINDPFVIPLVMGQIREKNTSTAFPLPDSISNQMVPPGGFPPVVKHDLNMTYGPKSIFLQNLQKQKAHKTNSNRMEIDNMSIELPSYSGTQNNSLNLPNQSFIVSQEAEVIHEENINVLSKMTEQDILEEQKKLISDLDPVLIEFIKSKRAAAALNRNTTLCADKEGKTNTKSTTLDEEIAASNISQPMDTTEVIKDISQNGQLWDIDILSHPDANKWLHFNTLEKDKLEWTKGIDESKKLNGDKPYEARFNFEGYLLPYTIEMTDKTKKLFHHGEEPHRPGYSLTELFELTRSSVIQQRVMALNTIAGILDYYMTGIYKDIIEIPMTKIFFIIRIAMDENKTVVLESALKAMRNLLYNRIDEASLDALLGFQEGTKQPCLEHEKIEIAEIESQEDELKDFHLADIDLIAGALRTDILQRLQYILDVLKPSFLSVQYCLQILTRLVRDSVETALLIAERNLLLQTIVREFVPKVSLNFPFDPQIAYNRKPILAALKFIRVLSLQSEQISYILVNKYPILESISEYISSGIDSSYGLRIQIEAFSILTNLLNYNVGKETAFALAAVLVTSLYKHVNGTDIFVTSSVISITHAAVLIQLVIKLLCVFETEDSSFKSQVNPLIRQGLLKWLAQLSSADVFTCGHLRLLCSVFDCATYILQNDNLAISGASQALEKFATSKGFKMILDQVTSCSNLLSGIDNSKTNSISNLISLQCSVIDSSHKVLPLLSISSPIPLLCSLFRFLVKLSNSELSALYIDKLIFYLNKLSTNMPSLCENWFTRIECNLICYILMIVASNSVISESMKDMFYSVANKLCYILRADQKEELDFIFTNIVFNKNWFTADRVMSLFSISDANIFTRTLNSISEIKNVYAKVINLGYRETGPNIILKKWQEPILPRDWIYLPILQLYSKSQELDATPKMIGTHATKVYANQAKEKEFKISCTLEWIIFNETCFPELLNDIDVTDRFCRILCVFLCDNSIFLEANVKVLLEKCTEVLFQKEKKTAFNFDKELIGLNNFQDFFTQVLEQFQAVSYGDATFAACVLVPLAQKHNVKWRKLIWSEYAGCLRTLDCPEDKLCYKMCEYLYPEETDESLIKSYHRALSNNLLRPNTVSFKIASHHVNSFKLRSK